MGSACLESYASKKPPPRSAYSDKVEGADCGLDESSCHTTTFLKNHQPLSSLRQVIIE